MFGSHGQDVPVRLGAARETESGSAETVCRPKVQSGERDIGILLLLLLLLLLITILGIMMIIIMIINNMPRRLEQGERDAEAARRQNGSAGNGK